MFGFFRRRQIEKRKRQQELMQQVAERQPNSIRPVTRIRPPELGPSPFSPNDWASYPMGSPEWMAGAAAERSASSTHETTHHSTTHHDHSSHDTSSFSSHHDSSSSSNYDSGSSFDSGASSSDSGSW